jgi:hypothetical protein
MDLKKVLVYVGFAAVLGFLLGRASRVEKVVTEGHGHRAEESIRGQGSHPVRSQFPLSTHTVPSTGEDSSEGQVPDGLPKGVTPSEYQEHLKISDRRDAGEFFLSFDDPVARRQRDHQIKELTEDIERNRYQEGHRDALQNRFGLSAEQAEAVDKSLSKIVQASVEAEMTMGQLLMARDDYERRVRSMMGDETFEQYREFERGHLARHEASKIQAVLEGKGVPVDPGTLEQLTGIIRENQAYTDNYWHGPFDGLPEIQVGFKAVRQGLQADLDRQVRGSAGLQSALGNLGLPPEMVASLTEHYAESIRKTEEKMGWLSKIDPLSPSEVGRMIGGQRRGP